MPRDILLVGGVGLDSAEDVFRTLGKELGPRVKRLTDGETGFARSVWIQCQKPFFFGHPLLEDMELDPDRPGELRPARVPSKGLYSHTAEGRYAGRSRLRAGVNPADLHFDNIGYGDWAIESYGIFKRLQQAGDVPATSKFQVCIPSVRVYPQRARAAAGRRAGRAGLYGRDEPRNRPHGSGDPCTTTSPSSGTAPSPWLTRARNPARWTRAPRRRCSGLRVRATGT